MRIYRSFQILSERNIWGHLGKLEFRWGSWVYHFGVESFSTHSAIIKVEIEEIVGVLSGKKYFCSPFWFLKKIKLFPKKLEKNVSKIDQGNFRFLPCEIPRLLDGLLRSIRTSVLLLPLNMFDPVRTTPGPTGRG